MRYLAVVTKEGRSRLAHFPDCPGCQTQADEGEDIRALAQEALEGWLEANLVQGQAPPTPSKKKPRVPKGAELIDVPVPPTLAVRIQLRAARRRAGLSQSELARKVNVSQQQIAALESPDTNMTLGTLLKVADALGQKVAIEISDGSSEKRRKRKHA